MKACSRCGVVISDGRAGFYCTPCMRVNAQERKAVLSGVMEKRPRKNASSRKGAEAHARYYRDLYRLKVGGADRACVDCGEFFWMSDKRFAEGRVRCGRCAWLATRAPEVERVCPTCDGSFVTNLSQQVYCSSSCSRLMARLIRYGLSVEEFHDLVKDDSCVVCGRSFFLENRKWMIDHCHVSGLVRGIICGFCNAALGMVKDDVSHLKELIFYLEGQGV